MNSRRAGVAAILFIFALLLLWVFSKYLPQQVMQFSSNSLTLVHTVSASSHQYKGKVSLEAPCDGVGVLVTAVNTETHVALMTQRLPGVTCSPAKTLIPFSFTTDHSVDPNDISVTLDGATIPVEIVEE